MKKGMKTVKEFMIKQGTDVRLFDAKMEIAALTMDIDDLKWQRDAWKKTAHQMQIERDCEHDTCERVEKERDELRRLLYQTKRDRDMARMLLRNRNKYAAPTNPPLAEPPEPDSGTPSMVRIEQKIDALTRTVGLLVKQIQGDVATDEEVADIEREIKERKAK